MDESFERSKICYEQNYLQFRSLNQIMWQVPIIAMTLTGGLWFGVSKVPSPDVQAAMLVLALAGNIGLTIVLHRIRYVMEQYLDCLKKFHSDGHVAAPGNGGLTGPETVVTTFKALLLISAALSLIGIFKLICAWGTPLFSQCVAG